MYVLKSQVDNKYYIQDTSDNSIDECTLSDISSFLKLGLAIAGVRVVKGEIQCKPINRKMALTFELGGTLYGISRMSEVYVYDGRKFCELPAKVMFTKPRLKLLSSFCVSNSGTTFLVCLEEFEKVNANVRMLKTHVYLVNTETNEFRKVDGMGEFIANKHKVLRVIDGHVCYGKKILANVV